MEGSIPKLLEIIELKKKYKVAIDNRLHCVASVYLECMSVHLFIPAVLFLSVCVIMTAACL